MNTDLDTIEIQQVNTEVLYQQDKAQVDIQISTAKQYPRNVLRSIQNSVALVTMDHKTASTCSYSVPRGGKAITGPSVHLAKIIAQNWGNLRIESRVIDIDSKHVTSQGICWDLENNIAIKTEVKRSIMTRSGRMNDDMITVTGNAGNSIALRNAILSVIPRSVVDKVYGEACLMITGDVSDETKLNNRRIQVFDKLKETYNVTEEEILSVVGKASISHITPDDLVVLIGVGQAIKDGDTTIELAFKRNTKAAEVPDSKIEFERTISFLKSIENTEKFKKQLKDKSFISYKSNLSADLLKELETIIAEKENELLFNEATQE